MASVKMQSISRRFSYALIGVVTLLLLGFATVAIFFNITRIETALQKDLENALKLSSISLPTPLWNLDNDVVDNFLEALLLDQSLAYTDVVWGGRVITKKMRPEFQQKDYSYFEQSTQFLVQTSDILYGGSKVGTMRLAMSRERIEKELLENIAGIIALTILLIAAISLTSMLITRRYIARPLADLQRSATLIARGDLETSIDLRGRDEIGRLTQDLTAMRDAIKRLFDALHDSNERLEESNRNLEHNVQERTQELRAKNAVLEETLEKLRAMQQQIIVQEKMASLGALTAGISHEIKNPLNFVNNFAALSIDLARDLRAELEKQRALFDADEFENIADLLYDLELNTQKINEHGKRADGIVQSMLLYSRGMPGKREASEINALVAEAVNLAYHGMRAQEASFNVTIETDYDSSIGKIDIVPQDVNRALLNIINNACYATLIKRQAHGEGFSPTLSVRTTNLGNRIQIHIRDNGDGISHEVREKMFQPFFTTKPPGTGTGLGLSISYDIVVQKHQGQIHVNTEIGQYTEFVITLPKQVAPV